LPRGEILPTRNHAARDKASARATVCGGSIVAIVRRRSRDAAHCHTRRRTVFNLTLPNTTHAAPRR
jgi:hypothetical protein